MKKLERDFIIAWIIGMLLPGLILWGLIRSGAKEDEHDKGMTTYTDLTVPQIATVPQRIIISVLFPEGEVKEIELENYLCGVVLAEMPADFEIEALKAQSVVARTYALRRLEKGTKHGTGLICTDPACCQGYLSPDDYLMRGGPQTGVTKVSRAVLDTAGYVLTYGGELIDATYFSCSGGMTEDASAVWGSDVPYLQATDSPGEESAEHYSDHQTFDRSEVERLLSVSLEGDPEDWFEILSYTDGGGVDKISVCGEILGGAELRKRLSLRSTNFTVEATDDTVTFYTKGYGHRVGMSQYGADAMAVSGHTYDEILAHYYSGTTLGQYQPGN